MRIIDRRGQLTRRTVLRGTALAVPGVAVSMAISPDAAWAQAAHNLKPATMATLAQAARDIYPHDRLADAHYITAISGYDAAAPAVRTMLEDGCAKLNAEAKKRHARSYIAVPDEADRVAILKTQEATPFFGTLRSGLVVSLYNQKSLWAKFGYEGASADKGGYIHRGFDDIDWLS
jgi:hypothetical protein